MRLFCVSFKHCEILGFSVEVLTFEALHWELWLFCRRCWCWELFSLTDGILTFRSCGFLSELCDEFGVFLKLLCAECISKLEVEVTRRLPMGTLKTTEKTVNKVAYLTFTRYTHFVLTPDLRVQILDNSCLMHEYFQVAKDCWHCWKNPNLANELSEPRIYTKYLWPETEKRNNFGDFVWKLLKKVSFWKKLALTMFL